MTGLSPVNLRERFITRSGISSYATRSQFNLDILRKNLEFSKRTFFRTGAEMSNNTPVQIRSSSIVSMFKRNFTEFLQKES